jgi:hypothetical protein
MDGPHPPAHDPDSETKPDANDVAEKKNETVPKDKKDDEEILCSVNIGKDPIHASPLNVIIKKNLWDGALKDLSRDTLRIFLESRAYIVRDLITGKKEEECKPILQDQQLIINNIIEIIEQFIAQDEHQASEKLDLDGNISAKEDEGTAAAAGITGIYNNEKLRKESEKNENMEILKNLEVKHTNKTLTNDEMVQLNKLRLIQQEREIVSLLELNNADTQRKTALEIRASRQTLNEDDNKELLLLNEKKSAHESALTRLDKLEKLIN